MLCSRQWHRWSDVGEERHLPSPSPTGFRGAVWIPPLLRPVADIVKNTIRPYLTFSSKIAGLSHFGDP